MNLDDVPIFDHHAHPLLKPEATQTPDGFRRWFTESTHPHVHAQHVEHTLLFRTAVRWLAEVLECAPTLEDVLAARAARPYDRWVQHLFEDANIETVLCDYGYGDESAYEHEEMQALLPCRVAPILRLETLAETLIRTHETFADVVAAFITRVRRAPRDGYVALKSIVAYRSGLDVRPASREDALAAYTELRRQVERGNTSIRLESKPLCDYLLAVALTQLADRELTVPVQFHTGFGDRDADLRSANPLHLRWLIEEYPEVPLVLLHAGWPFYRELAHLVAIYPNVWMDVSLAIPFATTGIPAMLRDVLGMAPFSKVLYATDAFTMPEIYWVAAKWGRWGLGRALERFVQDGFLGADEALDVAAAILGGNARALYDVDASS